MSDTTKRELRDFWQAEKIDLKRQDAIQTLQVWQAQQASQMSHSLPMGGQQALQMSDSMSILLERNRYYRKTIAKKRGFLAHDQQVVGGAEIVAQWRKQNGQAAAEM